MQSSSFAQARDALSEWGIHMSQGRMQTLVYRFAAVGERLRQRAIEQLRSGALETGQWLAGQRVVIAVDGGHTRIRRNKRGKRLKSGRRGDKGQWKEPKLLTIYAVDAQGKHLNHLEAPLTHDGTMASVKGFMELLQMHCVHLGLIYAEYVLLVSDGAEWIWRRIPTLLKTLGVDTERVIELIDFYHATTHLYTFAESEFSKTSEAKAWAKRACSQLK